MDNKGKMNTKEVIREVLDIYIHPTTEHPYHIKKCINEKRVIAEHIEEEIINSLLELDENEMTKRKIKEYISLCFTRGEKSISDLLYWLDNKED